MLVQPLLIGVLTSIKPLGRSACHLQVNMDPILQYIHACNEKALARDQDAKRTTPLASDDDPRVDICIYFLSPHRIKPIDLKFMTELSALVPLVPVLAKADSMTTNELDDFRKGVREALVQVSCWLGQSGDLCVGVRVLVTYRAYN